jgi:hypothetical protein
VMDPFLRIQINYFSRMWIEPNGFFIRVRVAGSRLGRILKRGTGSPTPIGLRFRGELPRDDQPAEIIPLPPARFNGQPFPHKLPGHEDSVSAKLRRAVPPVRCS